MKLLLVIFGVAILGSIIFSYGFVDPNLHLSGAGWYEMLVRPLQALVFIKRPITTGLYMLLLAMLFGVYIIILRKEAIVPKVAKKFVFISLFLLFAFPAFSYDLFNYMLTAKVAFFYHENPYLVMPIEIPNEPWLAFTRAANKVALYGPTWIGATFVPYFLGQGNVWRTIFLFKALPMLSYVIMCLLIYQKTKETWNVIFFALNPLVLLEVLVTGHNDMWMMMLAIGGILLFENEKARYKLLGIALWIASVFVKGATLVFLPVFLIKDSPKRIVTAFWLMLGVFFLTPIREELYPWYAVWFLSFAALLPRKKAFLIQLGCVVGSLGLLLRYLPYLYTREYGGSGPSIRLAVTVIPMALFFFWMILKRKRI